MQQVVIWAFKMHVQSVAWSKGQQLVLFMFWEGEDDSDRTRHFFFNNEWKANSICLILCVYFSLFFLSLFTSFWTNSVQRKDSSSAV